MPTSLFICGASKENDVELLDPSMAKPFKKRHFCRHHTKNKNPYSSRGLDTFEALLLDLQEKRNKIYTKNNGDLGGGISLVRFTYSSSTNDLVPIIVKNKDYNDKDKNMRDQLTKSLNGEEEVINKDVTDQVHYYWRRPSYYIPAVLMVLLVLLVFFGRSVAILCTSIGWYVVPALGSGSVEDERVLARSGPENKVFRRIWSDTKVMQLPEKRPKKLSHLRSLS